MCTVVLRKDFCRGAIAAANVTYFGPRPEVARYVACYAPGMREKVLSVRPGITDRASIEFLDEAAMLARAADPEREYIDVVLPIKLRLAVEYVEQASLAGDVRLIASTLKALLVGR